jgi:ankyrin repeat protein
LRKTNSIDATTIDPSLLTVPTAPRWEAGKGSGISVLHLVSAACPEPFVELVLAAGARPTVADWLGRTPVHFAAYTANVAALQLLVSAGGDINAVSHGDPFLRTPLHAAIYSNDISTIKILLDAGADPRVPEFYFSPNRTACALVFAANVGTADILRRLLAAIPGAPSEIFSSAINAAAKRESPMFLQDLVEAGAKPPPTAAHVAARSQRAANLRLLARVGADMCARDENGYTALHVAVGFNVVQTLLELAPNLATINSLFGESPLNTLWSGWGRGPLQDDARTSLVRLLVEHGCDLEARNRESQTILHTAARSGCASAMEIILRKRPSLVEIRDREGATPLHCAIESPENALSCVKLLVSFGCDLNAQNVAGDTPLHCLIKTNGIVNTHHPCMEVRCPLEARDRQREAVVKYLADTGAGVYLQDGMAITALQSAIVNGQVFSALALMDAKPDLSSINQPLRSLLLPAIERSQSPVVHRILAPDIILSTSCRPYDISPNALLSRAVKIAIDELLCCCDHNRRVCMRMMTGIMLGYTDSPMQQDEYGGVVGELPDRMQHAIEVIGALCDSSVIEVDPFTLTPPQNRSPFEELKSAWRHAGWDTLIARVETLYDRADAECCSACTTRGVRACRPPENEPAPRRGRRRLSTKTKKAIATLINQCLLPRTSDRIGPDDRTMDDAHSIAYYTRADGRTVTRYR